MLPFRGQATEAWAFKTDKWDRCPLIIREPIYHFNTVSESLGVRAGGLLILMDALNDFNLSFCASSTTSSTERELKKNSFFLTSVAVIVMTCTERYFRTGNV